MKRHIKSYNFIARIILTLYIIGAIFLVIIPAFKDFGNYINKKFKIINCKTISKSTDREEFNIDRTIQIIDINTSEKIEVTVNYTSIDIGEYYVIEYLPNIKVGNIIEKLK